MSYELLEKLHDSSLPVEIRGAEVDAVVAYVSAGLLKADIEWIGGEAKGSAPVAKATVNGLTRSGRLAVEKRRNHRRVSAFLRKL